MLFLQRTAIKEEGRTLGLYGTTTGLLLIISLVVAVLHLNVHNATLRKTAVEAAYGAWKDVGFVGFKSIEGDAEDHQGPLWSKIWPQYFPIVYNYKRERKGAGQLSCLFNQ